MGVLQTMVNPGQSAMKELFGNPVYAQVPEDFWTDDWCRGVRCKTYLGQLCDHSNPDEGRWCVQPRQESQAADLVAHCIVINPDQVTIQVLDGKLSDYA
jgi:hypothetical protein